MKNLIFILTMILSSFAFCATTVHGNVYMAVGGTNFSKKYFDNLIEIKNTFNHEGLENFELGTLTFSSGTVENNQVSYNFISFLNSNAKCNNNESATLDLNFIYDVTSEKVNSVKISVNCVNNDD